MIKLGKTSPVFRKDPGTSKSAPNPHISFKNPSMSSSDESSNFLSERSDHGAASDLGRFKVTRVSDKENDAEKDALHHDDISVILPASIFDEPKKQEQEYPSVVSRVSETLQNALKTTTLTLYEDDILGDVDSIQGVVKKTVDSNIQPLEEKGKRSRKANLGTFFGVFLPCCQNIVGVIFFVRMPWIVGTAGILEAFLIVFICNLMSFCTAFSMSAIATNGRVTAGGTYFMISRSLGPTFGGSVGFLFFMGTSISVAMYYLGTVETLLTYIAPELSLFSKTPGDGGRYNDYRLYGTILLLCMATVVFIGVTCVSRFAFFAILFLVAALLSIFVGLAVSSAGAGRTHLICALGDRLMRYHLVNVNGNFSCNKERGGPIYEAYCSFENGTEECEEYFLEHEARLIEGVPGFSSRIFMETLHNSYTEEGMIPGTDVKSNPERELLNDIATSFVVLIGIYFPSITGVESGSNYSGDLKDAQVSIPRGTIAAVIVTSTIYLSSVILFGGSVEGLLLRDKYGESISDSGDLVLSLMAWPSKWVVLVGTLTATIGAGLQALAGGPRLLQAIAEDNIIPHLSFFAKKWHGEPVRGLSLTFCIAELGILIAFLDYVAPIVTMFFLMCYGFINFAVTLQSLLDTPHWRPSFKYYHWSLTLFGTALCITTMFICSWKYALIAITVAFVLYQYIEYKGAEKEWGDGITGLSMSAALYALQRMKREYKHTKNWRPQVLVLLKMSDNCEGQEEFASEDKNLVMLANMMKEGKGFLMFGTVIKGELEHKVKEQQRVNKVYANCLDNAGVKGFIEVVISPSVVDGLACMIQSAGLAALRPNTILMGWPKDWTDNRNAMSYHVFMETMRNVAVSSNALIVLKADDFPVKGTRMTGTIDIWWIVNDGGMLLLLGHLLRRSKTWSKCKLRLFSVAQEEDNTVQIKKDLQTYLYQLRIEGTVEVVEMAEGDMTAYVYERTLKMEERTRMMQSLSKKYRKESHSANPKESEHPHQPHTGFHLSSEKRKGGSVRGKSGVIMSTPVPGTAKKKSLDREVQNVLENARSAADVPIPNKKEKEDMSTSIDKKPNAKPLPSEDNIRHMNTAVRLNAVMRERSSEASLLILNLPCVPESSKGQANSSTESTLPVKYFTDMSFLEVLTEGMTRLLLVRGTGREVITVYN